jgi:hypothetical protein
VRVLGQIRAAMKGRRRERCPQHEAEEPPQLNTPPYRPRFQAWRSSARRTVCGCGGGGAPGEDDALEMVAFVLGLGRPYLW